MAVEWNGDAFLAAQRKTLGDNLEKAAIYLVEKVKMKLNVSQPYKKSTDKAITTHENGKVTDRKERQRTNKGIYFYGMNPSAPGEPPHKLTGHLQRSITYRMSPDRMQAFVGSNLAYAGHLELGTSKMAARPFLRPTLAEEQAPLSNIVTTGKK